MGTPADRVVDLGGSLLRLGGRAAVRAVATAASVTADVIAGPQHHQVVAVQPGVLPPPRPPPPQAHYAAVPYPQQAHPQQPHGMPQHGGLATSLPPPYHPQPPVFLDDPNGDAPLLPPELGQGAEGGGRQAGSHPVLTALGFQNGVWSAIATKQRSLPPNPAEEPSCCDQTLCTTVGLAMDSELFCPCVIVGVMVMRSLLGVLFGMTVFVTTLLFTALELVPAMLQFGASLLVRGQRFGPVLRVLGTLGFIALAPVSLVTIPITGFVAGWRAFAMVSWSVSHASAAVSRGTFAYALQGFVRRRAAFQSLEADGPYTELRLVAMFAALLAMVVNSVACLVSFLIIAVCGAPRLLTAFWISTWQHACGDEGAVGGRSRMTIDVVRGGNEGRVFADWFQCFNMCCVCAWVALAPLYGFFVGLSSAPAVYAKPATLLWLSSPREETAAFYKQYVDTIGSIRQREVLPQ